MVQVKNLFGVSLREGFNKYAVAGLNAYVGLRNTRHTLPSLLVSGTDSTIASARYGMSDVLVGGQLIRTQGKAVHYNVDAEIVVAGDYAGDLRLKGHGELNLPCRATRHRWRSMPLPRVQSRTSTTSTSTRSTHGGTTT